MLWKNYFFTVDFSQHKTFLERFDDGDILEGQDAEHMAGVFQDGDPHPALRDRWNAHPEHDHSLLGVKVMYHGPNSDWLTTNAKFTHVMVLDFEETKCEQPNGRVYLQYNA